MPKNNSSNRNTEKKPNQLWTIVALLTLGILLVASYKFKNILGVNSMESAAIDDSCDLTKGPCTSILPNGGSVQFSITPNNIRILRPLSLQVNVEGIDISTVEVDLIGLNMDMGFNRPKLETKGDNTFKGPAILPVCSQSEMLWEAKVLLQTDRGLITAPFRFHTSK